MAAICFLAEGPKSIASVFPVVLYHISNLKSIGETVLKISRSQVGRTERQTDTDGRTDDRHFYVLPKLRLWRTITIVNLPNIQQIMIFNENYQ